MSVTDKHRFQEKIFHLPQGWYRLSSISFQIGSQAFEVTLLHAKKEMIWNGLGVMFNPSYRCRLREYQLALSKWAVERSCCTRRWTEPAASPDSTSGQRLVYGCQNVLATWAAAAVLWHQLSLTDLTPEVSAGWLSEGRTTLFPSVLCTLCL